MEFLFTEILAINMQNVFSRGKTLFDVAIKAKLLSFFRPGSWIELLQAIFIKNLLVWAKRIYGLTEMDDLAHFFSFFATIQVITSGRWMFRQSAYQYIAYMDASVFETLISDIICIGKIDKLNRKNQFLIVMFDG